MKFKVSANVFEKLNTVCFGFVIAGGVDNLPAREDVHALLLSSIQQVENRFASARVKEAEEIAPYREAFASLGINPNKFPSSIEAMASRVEKGKGFPQINSVVDLGNAVSLKYLVPLGAHDLDQSEADIEVRFSRHGDRFTPFGQHEVEFLADGELIYAVGDSVKTRRWIWRQSERGKVTPESRNIFFPIDGFTDKNLNRVTGARDELAGLLETLFGCKTTVGLVDIENREIEIEW